MDLPARSLALFILVLMAQTYARKHRHHHGRDKRQHKPASYVLDIPGPETGDWGPWSEPAPCSRTCGGGVSYQTRQCSQLSRVQCEGATKRYFSCNIQDCPEGSIDFRTEQCASFNEVPFNDVYFSWIPYTKAHNKCELNCMPERERFYYRHKDKVTDGTRCGGEKLDVCVDGKCLPVGCDHMLGSDAQEDQCRECGGDGSSCITVRGLLDSSDLQVGYNDLLLIPAGATNIRVHETRPTNNYLAIRNLTGHYYLNGNWTIDFPRSIKACGTVIHYERKPPGFFVPELISALGPITEPIYLVLLYQEKNLGIEYEYSIPKNAVQLTDPDGYVWVYNEFGPCSATCGGGKQTRNVWCAKRRDSSEVSRDLCDVALEPSSEQECAPQPCDPQWSITEWGPCSQTCGSGGSQTRQVICEQIVSGGRGSLVNPSVCEERLGPAPPTSQLCAEGPPCPTWHIGPWKPCDKLCGEGKQTRDIICFQKVNGRIEKMADEACPEEKPEGEKPCKLQPCEGVDWVTTAWSGCEDKCGLAFETRQAFCTTEKGELYPDTFCRKSRVPELQRECNATAACQHQWFASQWSECSAQCGLGVQTRKVFCGSFTDEGVQKTDDSKCDAKSKYTDSKNCTGEQECTGNWFAGPWTMCSKPCGGGQRDRKVLCMLNNTFVPQTQCNFDVILFTSEDCNNIPCGSDQLMTVAPEHKVDDYDEDDYCDYDEDFITTEGVQVDIEGSGLSAGADDLPLFTSASDSSSFGSEVMLSDGPSSLSTSGLSDTSLLVSFGSSEFSEQSGSAIWSTDEFEGSGESSMTTVPSVSGSSISTDFTSGLSDITSESSDISSGPSMEVTAASSELSSESTVRESESPSSEGVSSEVSVTSEEFSTVLSSESSILPSEISTLVSETVDASGSSESSPEGFTGSSESSSTENISETLASSETPTTQDSSSESSSIPETSTQTSESLTSEVKPESDISDILSLESKLTSPGDEDVTTESLTSVSVSESSLTSDSGLTESDSSSMTSSEGSTYVTSDGEISSSESITTADLTVTEQSSIASSEVSSESSSEITLESSSELSSKSPSEFSSELSSEISSVPSSDVSSESSTYTSSETSITGSEMSSSPLASTEYSITSETFGASTTELISIFSTELTTAAAASKRKCKPRLKKKITCLTSEFGCCYDNVTAAKGPFNKGCQTAQTCQETKHGCCSDGVSPAMGPEEKGCPPSQCALSLFGCCPDKETASLGNDFEGCPEEPTTPLDCKASEFGCCPDDVSAASGPMLAGCLECEGSGDCEPCNQTKYGCCPDGLQPAYGPNNLGCELDFTTEELITVDGENITDCENTTFGCCPDGIIAADGPNYEGCEGEEDRGNCSESLYGCCSDGNTTATGPAQQGCPSGCQDQQFGCCQDGITPAHGPNNEGCCLLEKFGCCPDNILPAQGPNLEGCGCQYTTYGCCPDNKTASRGPDNQGCGCQYTPHGCCPDQYSPAAGPGYQGCACHTYQFGCCPDGVTRAIGPNSQGCGCDNTEFGCCPDNRTPAPGPGQECLCAASAYGCCPDGITPAMGEHFEGCQDIPLAQGELCTLQKDRGTCREFTVKWFYDTEYGGCSRFWYGGCGGNENRFKTQEECRQTCVEPPGRDVCFLPKIEGPCRSGSDGYYPTWYYDTERKQCGQFIYGGCLGNANKFDTRELCEDLCVTPDTLDACDKPVDEGLCQGNFTRWFYDKESDSCTTFNYGGCKGNNNNFLTELACQQKCQQPDRRRDECALPRAQGSCSERLPRWFFDASENRCMPFYYGGCEGNGNQFETREVCEKACPPKIERHTCLLPALVGDCHNYTVRWYFDSLEAQCRQFYYGGCGGNNNNWLTQEECQRSCDHGYPAPPPPPPQDITTAPPPQSFTTEMCFLPLDVGDCREEIPQWFYDSRDGVCKQFIYGGCYGNGNRFNSRQECELRCGNVQDLCTLPRVVGPCSGVEPQFYYDHGTDSCHPFDYGGCQGNANRFPSVDECERRCRRAPPVTQPPPPPKNNICYLPVDKGPCDQQVPAWFFEPVTGQCQTFLYGGCEGNANRFSSIEQCDRQCGQFLGQDVCNIPVDVGPCVDQLSKWYYDTQTRTCQEFHYGGCDGSANRFSTLHECESICLHREELIPELNSSLSYLAICKLPADAGPCQDGQFTRWAFDESRQTCVAFTYHGCAGNLNRFKSFDACLAYCLPGHPIATHTVPPNEIEVDKSVGKNCEDVQTMCAGLSQCPYGVERWVDMNGCDNCRCYNPCVTLNPRCPTNTTCAVTVVTNPNTGQPDYQAVCRQLYKNGECPQLSGTGHCTQECSGDADCSGTAKCCYNGCGTSCLEPLTEHLATTAPDTYLPGNSAPEIYSDTPEIEADEGYFVTLRCTARGNPTPTIIWVRGGTTLSSAGGRYKFLTDGSLQIVGLVQSDAGEYICEADNGIGAPARKVFHVRVKGAKDRPAEVLGDDSHSVVASLGSRVVLQCYAYGYPAPSINWWRGERMLPFISADLEQRRDFSLVLHSVTLTSLGPYTCQAYNGKGRAASWTVTLKAYGPVYSQDPNDVTYNQYLVPPPRSPQPRPPPFYPPTTAATVRVFIVPVKTNISLEKTTFAMDSDISIPCDVDGYPVPKVIWYKDGQLLHPTDRIQISESSRLTVVQANANDAGTYKCEAANPYGSSFSEVDISVQGIYVDPLCTDNSFFADCHLVVQGQYCTHKYYGKFCCRSCTLAGQLPSRGPHLEQRRR